MIFDMEKQEANYDFVIVGSGLGGLVCGCILASEGYSVAILEKNHQIGGMLQVFSREKTILDTGVHYLGSLNPGENLYQLFKYLGILDELKLKRLGPEKVDVIRFEDGQEYAIPEGYDRFTQYLTKEFPEESEAIYAYCEKIREVCSCFPLYRLDASAPRYLEHPEIMTLNAFEYIGSITQNKRLQNVLAGTNSFLYAGNRSSTPFYVHALIVNSYLSGAFRLIDGGSQLAILLSRRIRNSGGQIFRRKKVTGARYDDKKMIAVTTEDGSIFYGKNFISNLHPASTVRLFGEQHFLKVYNRRITGLTNSISSFTAHLIFKPGAFPYLNYNIYQYHRDDVWGGPDYTPDTWPEQYFISTPAHSKSPEYAESMSVMAFMRFEEVAEWADSFNTVAEPGARGTDYERFKKQKEEQILVRLEHVFPGIRRQIKSIHSSTPLTFRDYTNSPDGSMYGISKTTENPLSTVISTKTHVPNLYLTGQNIFMHGILGVALGAVATCSMFLEKETLIRKIADA
ncbi:NAD(P)/FAD-dependent oxidoreductase [Ravibacter arvi]|uniref:NAD(P)/FAD-dependent oxidoreductase n=2 Tax=Ravibacter arvi TaxID=2051041 RepID=A0ABP8M5T7_9BACT